ncbi:hypothetical protein N2152v2_002901 [Parachlorella kessleri]
MQAGQLAQSGSSRATAAAASRPHLRTGFLAFANPTATAAHRQQQQLKARQQLRLVCSAAADTKAAAPASTTEEFYELYLDKPLGLKFGRGNDNGVYVTRSDPRLGNTSDQVTPGDKVVKVSASFGGDVWDALNYGQVVYAIKTRSGQVYLKLKKMGGDMTALEAEELSEEERLFKADRVGGNYGIGTKEMQERNYAARREAERTRRALFDEALAKFKKGKIEEALIDFENVLSMEPKNYLGDNFARVTEVYRVTQYNIACCFAALKQVDNGLEALNASLAAGFEDFDKVRKDPNLNNLRADKARFNAVIDKYDEPIINEAAINAIKNIFSFGRKKEEM